MPAKLYLASGSPRRNELINLLGVPWVAIEPPEIDETAFADAYNGHIDKLPSALAEAKVKLVMPRIREGFVVCADTDVIHNGEALGKPVDSDDARRMLKRLSGDWHKVVTGVSVAKLPEGNIITCAKETRVKFAELTGLEIDKYVTSGEPMDKAGAYGIQGLAAPYIESIEGCYFNVVGLPVHLLYKMLKDSGFDFG